MTPSVFRELNYAFLIITAIIALIVCSALAIKRKSKKPFVVFACILVFYAAGVAVDGYGVYQEKKWFFDYEDEFLTRFPEVQKIKMDNEPWGIDIYVYSGGMDEALAQDVIEELDKKLFEEKICPRLNKEAGEEPAVVDVYVFFCKSKGINSEYGYCIRYCTDGSDETGFSNWGRT